MTEESAVPVRVYRVPGISCDHCRAAIEGALACVAGVERVEVSVDAKLVTVAGEADETQIRAAIDDAGYDIGS